MKEAYGWDFTYKEYKLIFNSKQIIDDIPTVKSEFTSIIRKNQLELNDRILEAMNAQAENLYAKNCETYKEAFQEIINEGWGYEKSIDYENRLTIPGVFSYPANYIENQKNLIDIFLSIR